MNSNEQYNGTLVRCEDGELRRLRGTIGSCFVYVGKARVYGYVKRTDGTGIPFITPRFFAASTSKYAYLVQPALASV